MGLWWPSSLLIEGFYQPWNCPPAHCWRRTEAQNWQKCNYFCSKPLLNAGRKLGHASANVERGLRRDSVEIYSLVYRGCHYNAVFFPLNNEAPHIHWIHQLLAQMPFNKDNGTAGLISQEGSPSTSHLLFPPTFSLFLPPLSSTQLLLSNAPTPVFFPFKAPPHYSAALLLLFFPSSPSASPPTPLHLSIVLSFALSWRSCQNHHIHFLPEGPSAFFGVFLLLLFLFWFFFQKSFSFGVRITHSRRLSDRM